MSTKQNIVISDRVGGSKCRRVFGERTEGLGTYARFVKALLSLEQKETHTH